MDRLTVCLPADMEKYQPKPEKEKKLAAKINEKLIFCCNNNNLKPQCEQMNERINERINE